MTTTRKPWFQQIADLRKGGAPKDTIPQALADSWTEIMVEAARAFHEPDFSMIPAMDYADVTSDEDVEKRILGYQKGYDLEYMRRQMGADAGYGDVEFDVDTKSYDFSSLPWPIQRAVVSHWDRLHAEFLESHEGLSYYPDVGYVWLFDYDGDTVLIPHRDFDCGEIPNEDDLMRLAGFDTRGGVAVIVQGPYGAQVDIGVDYDL